MNETHEAPPDPTTDFLRLWRESAARILEAAGTFTPETLPPEMLRRIRAGLFQALENSWNEFMRSPQFLEGMKQMMDGAVAFRRMSADFLTRMREELQAPGREDIDDVLLALREMEVRLNRRVDELAAQVAKSGGVVSGAKEPRPGGASPKRRPAGRRRSGRKPK
jgi:hypothetical protein